MTSVLMSNGEVNEPVPGNVQRTGLAEQEPRTVEQPVSEAIDPELLVVARRLYDRRRRDAVMARQALHFREPGWDMLLDLFISHGSGRLVVVSSACLSAFIPQTTALRYVGKLETRGFICRRPAPSDGRRHHLVVSVAGIRAMKDYLEGFKMTRATGARETVALRNEACWQIDGKAEQAVGPILRLVQGSSVRQRLAEWPYGYSLTKTSASVVEELRQDLVWWNHDLQLRTHDLRGVARCLTGGDWSSASVARSC